MNSTGATAYYWGENKAKYLKLWIKINSKCYIQLNINKQTNLTTITLKRLKKKKTPSAHKEKKR